MAKGKLTPIEQFNLAKLLAVLEEITQSEPDCPGDGNLDKVVNEKDIKGVLDHRGQPSVFDFNNNGITDNEDLQIVLKNYGDQCFHIQSIH